jgi:hypothetical protein
LISQNISYSVYLAFSFTVYIGNSCLSDFILVGCKEVLGSSLFIVGEIGGNDYGFPLFDKNAFEELITYVPQVISVITSAIKVRI